MSEGQFEALIGWLAVQPADLPKFVLSGSSLLPRKLRAFQNSHRASALRSDSWEGYPCSFYGVLTAIAQKAVQNVVFLSGDEHVSFVARAELQPVSGGSPVVVHSVHSSALYAPFPFANAIREDFAELDCFDFDDPEGERRYRCTVQTCFAPAGDGYAVLHVARRNGLWTLTVEFDHAGGSTVTQYALT